MELDLHVIGGSPWMSRRCLVCDPTGKWEMVRVDVLVPARGVPLWPDAPVDHLDI